MIVPSTSTPASESIADVIAMCGADGRDVPVCTRVSPSVNAAPDSSSPETNWDDAEASMRTMPPGDGAVSADVEGHSVTVDVDAECPQPVEQGVIGRERAC